MAGKCIICGNLEEKDIAIEGKVLQVFHCKEGVYDGDAPNYFYLKSVSRPCKAIKDFEDNCDKWDDRLKGKG